jgi:cupin 2 domain-containing protein
MHSDTLKITNNFLTNIPNSPPEEIFEAIIQTENIKIERIISKGQKSEEGFWYDQDQAEFVLLLKGKARIQFETQTVELAAGDYLNIAAHQKHRVDWTTPDEETLWLAVFY